MSWFNLESIDDLKNKVQAAIPLDKEMLEKLTLTTPELTAERQQIDEEERRKENVKDSLAGMLPWETRDEEREILVEECKEAILALSSKEETFTGPYAMPKPTATEDGGNEEDDEKEYKGPSDESLAQLAKLEPLPSLLGDFDLDAHVGLIQRLLGVDPKLVEMQSILSGGGEKEKTFWRNYFFHCAFTRYEAGLSIDEIWSDQPPATESLKQSSEPSEDSGLDEITFEAVAQEQPTDAGSADLFSAPAIPTEQKEAASDTKPGTAAAPLPSAQSSTSNLDGLGGADFELVGGADEGSNEDSEMDELEAEIARELED